MHILLEPGDIIREGDERLSFGGTWQKCSSDVGKKICCSLFRRHLGPWEAVKHALESIPNTPVQKQGDGLDWTRTRQKYNRHRDFTDADPDTYIDPRIRDAVLRLIPVRKVSL